MTTGVSFSSELIERYERVTYNVAEAARKAGRSADDVTLLAVSKFHPVEAVEILSKAGHCCFAENYVQEALAKQNALLGRQIEWHFIGSIQSKKAKDVVDRFVLIHTVDRLKLAQNLQKRILLLPATSLEGAHAVQDILLQVNISDEGQKSGVAPEGLCSLMESVLELSGLRVRGLMGMPPFSAVGEAARPYFERLRELRDSLAQEFSYDLPHLSMGMSQDYAPAIEEGATFVRIGTDIFGQRPVV